MNSDSTLVSDLVDGYDLVSALEGMDDLEDIGDDPLVAAAETLISDIKSDMNGMDDDVGAVGGRRRRMSLASRVSDLEKVIGDIKSNSKRRKKAGKQRLKRIFQQSGKEITLVVGSWTLVNSGSAQATSDIPFTFTDPMYILGFNLQVRPQVGTLGATITKLSYGGSDNLIVSFNQGSATTTGGTLTNTNGLLLGTTDNQPTFIPFRKKVDPSITGRIALTNQSATSGDGVALVLKAITITNKPPTIIAQ